MYKNCKVILSDLDRFKEKRVWHMLIVMIMWHENELNKDKPAMIVGSYNNGGAVCVQYEIE